MALQNYVAAAGLGLFIMFVGLIISLYNFLIEPQIDIEPAPKVLQFISIGAAPAVIMAGSSYLLTRRYGSKLIGSMVIAGGAIMLVGMIYAYTLLDYIEPLYLVEAVTLAPPIFIIVSIPVMIVGAMLLKEKERKKKKDYV